MFGSEQALIQSKTLLRIIYRLIGEFRFPIRLRGYYLAQVLPSNFFPHTIWDAGCGAGHTSFYLMRRFSAAKLLGSDLNPEMVRQCSLIAEQDHLTRAEFVIGDLCEMKSEKEYDLVTCFEVLEHIEDYDAAISNLCSSLKPGGYLIVHTPSDTRFQEPQFGIRRFGRQSHWSNTLEKGQFHVRPGFQLTDLVETIQRHQLAIERIEYTFGPLAMHAHTIYEFTRTRKPYMLATYGLLMGIGLLDWQFGRREGGGLLLLAKKPLQ